MAQDKFEKISISDIRPAGYNPRKISEADKDKLKNSLKEFGLVDPIIINLKNNTIIGGHMRYEALLNNKKLKTLNLVKLGDIGWAFSDVDLKVEDEEHEKALNLALNKISGEWDLPKLEIVLNELSFDDYDLRLTGFDDLALEELNIKLPSMVNENTEDSSESNNIEDDSYNFNADEIVTDIKAGDIYQLGEHRLICGDCLDSEVMNKLMQGDTAGMVFTDPPYFMDFTGSVHADGSKSFNSGYNKIANDDLSKADAEEFLNNLLRCLRSNVSGAYYICFYRLGLNHLFKALDNINNKYRALIIWNKGNHTLSNSDYMSHYEPIVYGWFGEHNWFGNKDQKDIWNIKRTSRNDLHPTMKPVELSATAIVNSSEAGDIVLDTFGGSGSTLIACEQLYRRCFMVELDPVYCQVIINRWEAFTGEKAVKL